MKKLYIDPEGGIAGDMFASALISLGAAERIIIDNMEKAASYVGKAKINIIKTDDALSLDIAFQSNEPHLKGCDAREYLQQIYEEINIKPIYRLFGNHLLDILIEAEREAHSKHHFFNDHFHHHSSDDVLLHEAQDILIDITGCITGLQLLDIDPEAILTNPVSVGNGTVNFSHGKLPVPAPATDIILKKYNIPWKYGPVNTELCTPTGAAILGALKATKGEMPGKSIKKGCARGTKKLDIPPLCVVIDE